MNTLTGGRYRLGNKAVHRVGYGAMQLAGDVVVVPPRDRREAIAVLRAAVDAGVDRTAWSPDHLEAALAHRLCTRQNRAGAAMRSPGAYLEWYGRERRIEVETRLNVFQRRSKRRN
jgi:hypothetical protein